MNNNETKLDRAPDFDDRICNVVPSRGVEKDWGMIHAVAAGVAAAAPALPPSVDLREPWWSINDQEQTGSCVGWASADGVVRYQLVMAGLLGRNELLSSRFVWMGSKETDEFTKRPETFVERAGTSLKAAMDILRNFGVVPDSLLPFHINTSMYPGEPDSLFAVASKRKIASYYNFGKNFDEWRRWIASGNPVLVGLNVDRNWKDAASTNGDLTVFDAASADGGHAVAAVGYTRDRIILRNSWGTSWGDGGFGYATPEYLSAACFDESYGASL